MARITPNADATFLLLARQIPPTQPARAGRANGQTSLIKRENECQLHIVLFCITFLGWLFSPDHWVVFDGFWMILKLLRFGCDTFLDGDFFHSNDLSVGDKVLFEISFRKDRPKAQKVA